MIYLLGGGSYLLLCFCCMYSCAHLNLKCYFTFHSSLSKSHGHQKPCQSSAIFLLDLKIKLKN